MSNLSLPPIEEDRFGILTLMIRIILRTIRGI